jgi:hypothetical protein
MLTSFTLGSMPVHRYLRARRIQQLIRNCLCTSSCR